MVVLRVLLFNSICTMRVTFVINRVAARDHDSPEIPESGFACRYNPVVTVHVLLFADHLVAADCELKGPAGGLSALPFSLVSIGTLSATGLMQLGCIYPPKSDALP